MITTTTQEINDMVVETMGQMIIQGVEMLINGRCDAITPSSMVDRELVKWHRGLIHGDDLVDVIYRELGTEVAHNMAAALGLWPAGP